MKENNFNKLDLKNQELELLYLQLIEETCLLRKEVLRLNNKINSVLFEEKRREDKINNILVIHKTKAGRKSRINFYKHPIPVIENNKVVVKFT